MLRLIINSHRENRGNEGQTIFKELTDNFPDMVKNRDYR